MKRNWSPQEMVAVYGLWKGAKKAGVRMAPWLAERLAGCKALEERSQCACVAKISAMAPLWEARLAGVVSGPLFDGEEPEKASVPAGLEKVGDKKMLLVEDSDRVRKVLELLHAVYVEV